MKKKNTAGSTKKGADVTGHRGESWLYTEKVKDHFFHPRNIFYTDKEAAEYEKKADGVGQVGSPACLLPDQKVITNEGLLSISQVRKESYVLGYEGTFNKVTEKMHSNFSGEIIHIKSRIGVLSLTPDHLVFSIRRPPGHKYNYTKNKLNLAPQWNPVSSLRKNDFVIYPKITVTKDIKYLNLNLVKKKWDFNSKDIPTRIKLEPELLRLFGYFIAEGSTRKDYSKWSEVIFTFSSEEGDLVEDTVKLLKKYFNLDSTIQPNIKNHRCDVKCYSIHLSSLLKELFGEGAGQKHFSDFFLYLPIEKQEELLCGMWKGDGYINLKRKFPRAGYATISPLLAQQIKMLLMRQNIVSSIYPEKEKITKGVNHKPSYRLHIGDISSLNKLVRIVEKRNINFPVRQINSWFDYDFLYTPVTKINSRRYLGKVINLEVNDSHTYTTDSLCVHNCGDVMKLYIKVDRKTQKIKECRWKTFGCASAIASTSIMSEMAIGKTLEQAKKITPQDIVKALGGLPARKIHCSVLGDQALRAAIEDYEKKRK